jgi:hypothetical protein
MADTFWADLGAATATPPRVNLTRIRFRTIQACPKETPGLREIELAANRPIGPSS